MESEQHFMRHLKFRIDEVGRKGVRLRPGMTLAIEPMINIGTHEVDWLDDDWTVVTEDGSLAAHYETDRHHRRWL